MGVAFNRLFPAAVDEGALRHFFYSKDTQVDTFHSGVRAPLAVHPGVPSALTTILGH